ncbi:acetylornithine aminotransferase [Coemansia sp. RSA 1972]|nr:acetylornithine aminotransferase [Coemansia sp. RSA 1972]
MSAALKYQGTRLLAASTHSGSQTVANAEKYTLNTYTADSLTSRGSYLYDTNGKEYLDFAGIAVVALGHNHPDITAVVDQASKLVHCSNLYHNEWASQLASNIVESTTTGTQGIYAQAADGRSPARVFFSNSGAEANEGALKYGKHVAELGTGQGHI